MMNLVAFMSILIIIIIIIIFICSSNTDTHSYDDTWAGQTRL